MKFSDLFKQAGGQPFILAEGVIASNASAVDDKVSVVVPAYSSSYKWEEVPWGVTVDASGDVLTPNKGDRCCVGLAVTDDEGEPEMWILEWWPYD